ncbi:hypothetical protein ACWD0G_10975, partial [Streptomyces goshikiensis]
VGDTVRVTLSVEELQEDHFGTVRGFFKKDRKPYKRPTSKPYGVIVETHHAYRAWVRLDEVFKVQDDFDVITDWHEVHKGAMEFQNWTYHCMGCARTRPTWMVGHATVLVIHKLSGVRERLCTEHHNTESLVRLGESAMWDVRRAKTTLFELRENPELLRGDTDEADLYRQVAECILWALPPEARAVYDELTAAKTPAAD